MVQTQAFCAFCQAETNHSVTYDVNEKNEPQNIIKLTCVNTTPEVEHCLKMSGTVTRDEAAAILAEHKKDFQKSDVQKAAAVEAAKVEAKSDDQKLEEIFS